jgi:transketolase
MPTSLSPDQTHRPSRSSALAMDAPLKAKSGHQGTAMALAPLGHVLYSRIMKHDPADRTGPTAIVSCCRTAMRRSFSTRCCTCPGYGLELET